MSESGVGAASPAQVGTTGGQRVQNSGCSRSRQRPSLRVSCRRRRQLMRSLRRLRTHRPSRLSLSQSDNATTTVTLPSTPSVLSLVSSSSTGNTTTAAVTATSAPAPMIVSWSGISEFHVPTSSSMP